MKTRNRWKRNSFLTLVAAVAVCQPGPIEAGAGSVSIPIRWCALQGTSAVLNPGCVGESTTKNVLWRRHERPTDYSYTPNCKVTWRSGAIQAQPTFPVIPDPCDPATTPGCAGVTGDVFVDPATFDYGEYYAALNACAAAWNAAGVGTIGVIGVNIRRFVNAAGAPIDILGLGGVPTFSSTASQMSSAGGFAAIDNDFTLPSSGCLPLVISDPTDQVVGHVAGRAVSLQHLSDTVMNPTLPHSNVLTTGGQGQADTSCPAGPLSPTSQCGRVRLQAMCQVPGVNVGPPPVVDQFPHPVGDATPAYVDLGMTGFIDDARTGRATFYWETTGLFPANITGLEYSFAADLDRNSSTGGSPSLVGVSIPISGAELVGRVVVDVQTVMGNKTFTATESLWKFQGGSFVPQATLGSQAGESRIGIAQIPPAAFPGDTPFVPLVSMDFGRTLALLPGATAVGDVDAQPRAEDPNVAVDLPGFNTLFMNTPALPVCTVVGGGAVVGGTFSVTAEGLPPNETTHVLIGPDVVATGVTDPDGRTEVIKARVPETVALGDHLVTIGVEGNNAVTADCTMTVQPRPQGAIPALSPLGMAVLAALFLGAGAFLALRRRGPSAGRTA
jgi:hypothetical protein